MVPMIDIAATLGNPGTWLGYQRMMDAVVKGEKLSDVLLNLSKHHKQSESINFDRFNGGLICLLDSWSKLVVAGVTVTGDDKRVEGFLNGSRARMLCDLEQAEFTDPGLFAAFIFHLCYVVNHERQSIRFTVIQPAPAADKPLSVRIVSEPDRITTQTVQRDENMEIFSTSTLTTDARKL